MNEVHIRGLCQVEQVVLGERGRPGQHRDQHRGVGYLSIVRHRGVPPFKLSIKF